MMFREDGFFVKLLKKLHIIRVHVIKIDSTLNLARAVRECKPNFFNRYIIEHYVLIPKPVERIQFNCIVKEE